MSYTIREATKEDTGFLVEMAALFGHGQQSGSVAGWLREGWDFGLVVEDDGVPIGAVCSPRSEAPSF